MYQGIGRIAISYNVVNESAVEEEVGGREGKDSVFVDDKVDCCPGRGWGYSHSGAGCLAPVYVTKLDEVVLEYHLHCGGECIGIVVVECLAGFTLEELCDMEEGWFGTDVGVH